MDPYFGGPWGGAPFVPPPESPLDGTVEHYKARLVAKGFTQQECVDFTNMFSPVAKLASVKLLLSLAAIKGWSISQMDVSNAFLHSNLDEYIFMSLPHG